MNRGPSSVLPEGLAKPPDIDIDTLDQALMELLTSDWQTLDEGESQGDQADVPGEQSGS